MLKTILGALMIAAGSAQAAGAAQTASGAASEAPAPSAAPAAPQVAAPADAGAGIAPFAAHFVAQWKDINVGTSDLELAREPGSDRYVYTWNTRARGLFRILYSHDVVQKSVFRLHGKHVRPEEYRAQEGDAKVSVDFDWATERARGTSAGKPLDLALRADTQDVMSIQVEVMQDLKNGDLPQKFWIFDKDEIKDFEYTREGPARIRTELGVLDTVVVASRRPGGDRVLRMWFAPTLGYVPVQAERTRGGKLEFAMRIQRLRR